MDIIYFYRKEESSMYLWQMHHIVDELAHHNINIHIFNIFDFKTLEEANENIVKQVAARKYDLFMTDQNKNTLFLETVIKLRELSIPRLLIHFDNLMEPKRHIGYAQYFDAVMLLNQDNDFDYKEKYKTKCIMTSYAANPFYFRDLRNKNFHHDGICFVGTPYGTRCIPINKILNANLKFDLFANPNNVSASLSIGKGMTFSNKIHTAFEQLETKPGRKVVLGALKCKIKPIERLDSSNEFLNLYDAVDLPKMNKIYSNYSLSLSMPEARNTGVLKKPINIVHLRNFEIPMCTGLQITKYFSELANYFEEGKEILFYESDEELIDKVRYYTDPKHQKEVDLIKSNARYRSENEHSWYKRFMTVFEILGIK